MMLKPAERLSASQEDYLEAIAFLTREYGFARVKDIGQRLQVRNASVCGALNGLVQRGLVVHERYGRVELTRQGARIAASTQQRHDVLIRFLSDVIGVCASTAEADACKIEHTLSEETFQKLTRYLHRLSADGGLCHRSEAAPISRRRR